MIVTHQREKLRSCAFDPVLLQQVLKQNILVTLSQMPLPDVNRELAEVGVMVEVFRAAKGDPPSS